MRLYEIKYLKASLFIPLINANQNSYILQAIRAGRPEWYVHHRLRKIGSVLATIFCPVHKHGVRLRTTMFCLRILKRLSVDSITIGT